MGIHLPKYTINTIEKKPAKIVKALLPVVVVLGLLVGYFASGLYADQTIKTLQERNDVLEESHTQNQDAIAQKSAEISILKTEKKVKQQAIQLLQGDYKNLIKTNTDLESEIAFYQRLLSPNVKNKGLRVFETTLTKQSSASFKLKIILAQKIERAKNIVGTYKVTLIGNINKQAKTIDISENTGSKFDFKYYYTVSLNFSVPEGFKPEQLVVELLPKIKKAKTIKHVVNWQSLIKAG